MHKEKFQKAYHNVALKFPEIRHSEIKLECKPDEYFLIKLQPFNEEEFGKTERIIKEPKISVGKEFFKLKDDEQEALIAHELGHYMREKDSTPYKMGRTVLRKVGLFILNHNIEQYIHMLTPARTKRLKQWSLMHEISADNYAVRAGYAKQIYKLLKDQDEKCLTKLGQEERKARIENLEKMLNEI